MYKPLKDVAKCPFFSLQNDPRKIVFTAKSRRTRLYSHAIGYCIMKKYRSPIGWMGGKVADGEHAVAVAAVDILFLVTILQT